MIRKVCSVLVIVHFLNDRSADVVQGERGEILVRSDCQMLGYINNPAVTAETMDKDLWVYTGDVGVIDKNENLWIVDRIK